MKIQLYAVPGFSGAASTLRKLDGVWTAVNESTICETIDYIHEPGYPVDQSVAESRVKYPILINRGMARFYGIPDDVDLYDAENEQEKRTPLRAFRLAEGMTQQQLSKLSGVNSRQIQKVESGEIKAGNMTASNLLAIADALGVDPRSLIQDEGTP